LRCTYDNTAQKPLRAAEEVPYFQLLLAFYNFFATEFAPHLLIEMTAKH
jgi:hypothetical protein